MTTKQTAHIVVDLGFGDAGKGSLTDLLARRYPVHTVVRYNGGAQAGHNVVTPDGRHHTFSQFGSATFVPGVRTHLSEHMIVHPPALLAEEAHLSQVGVRDAFARLTIDERALVITPFHQAANRLREMARGGARHGSCGLGVGETAWDATDHPDLALRAGDLRDHELIRRKLIQHHEFKRAHLSEVMAIVRHAPVALRELAIMNNPDFEQIAHKLCALAHKVQIVAPTHLEAILARPGDVVFEGAQGVLLDEWYGFFPYCTRSTITPRYAREILASNAWSGEVATIGLMRAYQTRHGAGPFVTEDLELGHRIPDLHNALDTWQQHFRIGWLDLVATRYAIAACGSLTSLAVMSLDRLTHEPNWIMAVAYDIDGQIVSSLPLAPEPSLDFQRQLTQSISRAQPIYRLVPGQDHSRLRKFLEHLESELKAPIKILGFGPTADDKIIRDLDGLQARFAA